jgi:dihydroorotase
VAHVSTEATVRLLRDAKKRGLPVTCEVTPHHLTLTDEACTSYDTSTKCAPPLRTESDRAALLEGLADGTIDCIATDHAPHTGLEKDLEYDLAAFGMIGLETCVPLIFKLVDSGVVPLLRAVEALTAAPARTLTLGPGVGTLAVGAAADLTVIDPARNQVVDRHKGRSKSQNTPFHGWELRGRAVLTVCGGKITHDEVGLG